MAQNAVAHARVVAVDDSSEFLSSLECFFETAHDFQLIATARSGHEALTLVQELRPDLVLMDLQMPGMNGLEAASEIRQRFSGVGVVIITAHEVPGLRQICHENYGACGFVKKSRLYQELPDALAKFLVSHKGWRRRR
jgi:DNA-binding NarL/FixJ family response regulator